MTDAGVPVSFTAGEVDRAVRVGVARQLAAIEQARRSRFVTACGRFAVDIVGAWAEYAVAKLLGVRWVPNIGGNDAKIGDVCGFHVRGSVARPWLPIRPDDLDRAPFVFVTGEPPTVYVRGWIYAGAAKRRDDWYRDEVSPPYWQTPVGALAHWETRPMLPGLP